MLEYIGLTDTEFRLHCKNQRQDLLEVFSLHAAIILQFVLLRCTEMRAHCALHQLSLGVFTRLLTSLCYHTVAYRASDGRPTTTDDGDGQCPAGHSEPADC